MPNRYLFVFAAILGLAGPATAEEFRDLFNGKDFDGWTIDGPKNDADGKPLWSIKEDCIACTGKAYGFLRYDKRQYGDFILRLEFRMAEKCNSGIGIRTPVFDAKDSEKTRPSYAAYEVQLADDAGKPAGKEGTGSLFRYLAPAKNSVKAAGEWNTLEIECLGPKIRVTVNGERVLEADQRELADLNEKEKPVSGVPAPKDKPMKGYVSLQSHTNGIAFRKLQIKEIKAAAPGGK